MPDQLTVMYDSWRRSNPAATGDQFAAFQGGLTSGAVSMRARAMKVLSDAMKAPKSDLNDVMNKIGALSDIP